MKDPAVLFYTSDFISGTITMSDEQRGQYIMLLCLQHQKGFLTEKDMLKICKTYDEDIWCKFIEHDGKFYNERMKNETERRKKYSESRRKNRTAKNKDEKKEENISGTYVNHMETETIIIIIDRIKVLCNGNYENVFSAFEKWRDYLTKQYNITMLENQYTYQNLEQHVKNFGVDGFIDAVNNSILKNYKTLWKPKENSEGLELYQQLKKKNEL